MKTPLAPQLSRRVVLKAAGGAALLTSVGCGEEAGLLVDGLNPFAPYPLDTEGDDEMPRDDFHSLYDPLLLYARATVSPGSNTSPVVAGLVNPHGLPMELLEVRWLVYPNSDVDNPMIRLTGMSVGVKMDMGDIPIVDADVPVNAFGNVRDDDDLQSSGIYPDPTNTDVFVAPSGYRWRLKYPLYIPAGNVLAPTYTHLGQNHFPLTIDTIYIARTLPLNHTMPHKVRVPWAGSFNSVSFDNVAAEPASGDFSSELDIVNPFIQPLEIARLTGRVSAVFQGITGIPTAIEDRTDHRFRLGKVRARARSGDELARTPTPFNGLFPMTWRAWDIPSGWMMRPGEFYKIQLSVGETDTTAPTATQRGSIQYAVSAIGYRELARDVFLAAAKGAQ